MLPRGSANEMRKNHTLLRRCTCIAAAMLLGSMTGCPPPSVVIPTSGVPGQVREVQLGDELARLNKVISDLSLRIEHLTADLRVIAATSQCKPEVQKAFADLRDLCLKDMCIKQTAATNMLIEEAGGFAILLQSLPHEVFYFENDDPILNEDRPKWLTRLASQVASKTQFLVLAFVDAVADKGEAQTKASARGAIMLEKIAHEVRTSMMATMDENMNLLLNDQSRDINERRQIADKMKQEKEKIDIEYKADNKDKFLKGIIDIPLSPKVLKLLRPTDLPQSGFHEPTNKLKRSVWIFRVNC